ncbi:MAG: hypothetical protein V4714_15385 [Bacteroidota bacterium]
MWIPFDEMPAQARIWIYQANCSLSAEMQQTIETYLENQIAAWSSHGSPIRGSAKTLHNRFVVVAADEAYQAPSGCSIDKSVHWLKELGNMLAVDFFDRSVTLLKENKVESVPLNSIKKHIDTGMIGLDTIVFNNTVISKEQMDKDWSITAKKSWMARYFVISQESV